MRMEQRAASLCFLGRVSGDGGSICRHFDRCSFPRVRPPCCAWLQFVEIEQSGQTLEDMASGVQREQPEIMSVREITEAHTRTQSLVSGYGEANIAVSKLTGTVVFMDASSSMNLTSLQHDADFGRDGFQTVGTALQPHPLTGLSSWESLNLTATPEEAGPATESHYWLALGGPENIGSLDSANLLSFQMTMAFEGLRNQRWPSFTVSFWQKADAGSINGDVTELLILGIDNVLQEEEPQVKLAVRPPPPPPPCLPGASPPFPRTARCIHRLVGVRANGRSSPDFNFLFLMPMNAS